MVDNTAENETAHKKTSNDAVQVRSKIEFEDRLMGMNETRWGGKLTNICT